jgi:hypothetical protein
LQQPFEQVLALHWQAPMLVSQSLLGQVVHAKPPLPHWALDSAVSWTHVVPLQHPFGHEAGSQTQALALHSCPLPHVVHAAPFLPHAALVSVVMQFPEASQQPFGHDVPSQTHWPVVALHSCPDGHAVQVTPFAPHAEFDSLPIGSHVAPLQHPLHAPPPEQVHEPPTQACVETQEPHALPPVPHWPVD